MSAPTPPEAVSSWLMTTSLSDINTHADRLRRQRLLDLLARPLSAASESILSAARLMGQTGSDATPLATLIARVAEHEDDGSFNWPGRPNAGHNPELRKLLIGSVVLRVVQALGPQVSAGCPHCGHETVEFRGTGFEHRVNSNGQSRTTRIQPWAQRATSEALNELDGLWNTLDFDDLWMTVTCASCGADGWPMTMVVPVDATP